MTAVPKPTDKDVQDIIAGLLDLPATVTFAEPLNLVDANPGGFMGYVTDDDRPAVLAICDLAFLHRVGAALVRVPAEAAERPLRDQDVDRNLADNTAEVLNVLARLLNSHTTVHLRAVAAGTLPGPVSDPLRAIDAKPGHDIGFEVSIPGYGRGRITLKYARPGTF